MHDSRSENVIIFEVSSWIKVSYEDYDSMFSIFPVDETDDSLELVSLMWLEGWEVEEVLEVLNEVLVFKDDWRSELAFSWFKVSFEVMSSISVLLRLSFSDGSLEGGGGAFNWLHWSHNLPTILEDWILSSSGSSSKSWDPKRWSRSKTYFSSWQAKLRLISESQDECLDQKEDSDSKKGLGSSESFS